MARTSIKKDTVKSINYLNKDFSDFKTNLIEFAKQYFPNTYNDFNEASPGMMFIEMASYVGDVLSYYIDNQFKESILAYAEEMFIILHNLLDTNQKQLHQQMLFLMYFKQFQL